MNKNKPEIRVGTIEDRNTIKDVCFQAYSGYESMLLPEDWMMMKRNLEDEASFSKLFSSAVPIICAVNGEIAGAVFLVPKGNETPFFSAEWAHIRMLGVLPQYRGLGIAHALMQKCIDHARDLGEATIALHTSGFQKAWPIYERLGFQKIKDIGPLFGNTYWLYTIDLESK